jgi:hypothetical protein
MHKAMGSILASKKKKTKKCEQINEHFSPFLEPS